MSPRDPFRDRPDAQRRAGDDAEAPHPRPRLEPPESPDRNLLEAEHVGAVGGRELDHAAEVGGAAGRVGVAVEDVPGAHDEPHRRPRLRVASALCVDARRSRRSPRVHAAVRPRARGCAGPRRGRGRARHVAVPLRRTTVARGVRARRELLPAVEPHRAQGAHASPSRRAEHPAGMRRLLARRGGRAPPPVARRARARRPAAARDARRSSSPRTTSCRGARPGDGGSGGACSGGSTGSSSTRIAAATRSRRSASTGASCG